MVADRASPTSGRRTSTRGAIPLGVGGTYRTASLWRIARPISPRALQGLSSVVSAGKGFPNLAVALAIRLVGKPLP